MCGRVTLRTSASSIADHFQLAMFAEFPARFNIVPTQQLLVVRGAPAGAVRQGSWLRWGLVPAWSKDPAVGQINARSETVAEKPTFRDAFRTRRCLIAADGFYEWDRSGRAKKPYHIHRKDDQLFAMAGLWERWTGPNQTLETCAIITTESNDLMMRLHDRMPVILSPDDYDRWLAKDADPDSLQGLFTMGPTPELELRLVSNWVNNARHDDEKCLEPAPKEVGDREQYLF